MHVVFLFFASFFSLNQYILAKLANAINKLSLHNLLLKKSIDKISLHNKLKIIVLGFRLNLLIKFIDDMN